MVKSVLPTQNFYLQVSAALLQMGLKIKNHVSENELKTDNGYEVFQRLWCRIFHYDIVI